MDALVQIHEKALPAEEEEVAEGGEHGGAMTEHGRAEGEHIGEEQSSGTLVSQQSLVGLGSRALYIIV